MAEFLTTRGISAQLEDIIKNAEERIVLISPYLQVDEQLKRRIESQADSGLEVHIVYRELNSKNSKEEKWLDSVDSIRASVCDDLHAKCYLNESEALLTSMNLYKYSERHNYEMGIIISIEDDEELYQKVVKESEHIIEVSKEVRTPKNSKKRSRVNRTRKQSGPKVEAPKRGFCIRCGTGIPANPLKPYCNRCHANWNRYKNADYEEEVCHLCRNEHETSMSKPVCLACYRRYRNVLDFQQVIPFQIAEAG